MTNAIQYIDVDHEDYEDAPKALRDAYKALRKQHEATVTERDGAQRQLAERSLADVLGDKQFKNVKAVEKAILGDGVDASNKEAIETWLAENGDDYAKADASSTPPPPVPTPPHPAQAGYQQMQNAGSDLHAPADNSAFDAATAEISALGVNPTAEQIRDVYIKHGI